MNCGSKVTNLNSSSTDGATTIFIQDVEKSWFRSSMQQFSMREKNQLAGWYLYTLLETNIIPWCSLKSSLPTTIFEQQTTLGAVLTCDSSQMAWKAAPIAAQEQIIMTCFWKKNMRSSQVSNVVL